MFLQSFHQSAESSGLSGRHVLWLAFLIVVSALPLHSQRTQPTSPSSTQPPQTMTPPDLRTPKSLDYGPPPAHTPTFEEQQYLRYLESRLKSMVSDADKLLKLAEELNRDSKTSNPASSSPDDIRALAEIEKLAHSVKWKMQLVADASRAR